MSNKNETIFQKIEHLTVNFSVSENASESDKHYVKLLKQGIEESNYKKIYEVVEAIERGIGFSLNTEISALLQEAIIQDENQLVNILNKKLNLFDLIIIVNHMDCNLKLKLLHNRDIENYLLLYELIRSFIDNRRNNDLETNYIPVVADGIVKLSNLNVEMFKYLIKKSEYKRSFALLIGNALNNLTTNAIIIYIQTITIDKYNHNLNNAQLTIKCLKEETTQKICELCCNYLIDTWNQLLDDLSEKEPILNNIVISSYINFILMCMCYKYSDAKYYYTELEKVIESYEDNVYKWKTNKSKEYTLYFIELTKIYMLKVVKDNNLFTWGDYSELHKKVQYILNNSMLHKRYWDLTNENRYEKLGLNEM